MNAQRRLNAILALSAVGVAIALYLSWVALWAEGNTLCTGAGDCTRVQQSQYARAFGVPVAVLGLGMYVAILAMTVVRRRWPTIQPRQLEVLTVTLAVGGTAYSAYLTGLELFVIHAICEWCVTSAIIITVIALLTLPDLRPDRRTSEPPR